MSLFDHIPTTKKLVPTKKLVQKNKYYVKDHNDPIPFGKFKGLTLKQLHQLEVTRDWFVWADLQGLFGTEDFWPPKTMDIYNKILKTGRKGFAIHTYYGEEFETDGYGYIEECPFGGPYDFC